MIRRFLSTLTLVALTSLVSFAQQVSQDEASNIARNFWASSTVPQHKAKSNAIPQLAYTAKKNNATLFYVFNNANDEGFVIVGGDKTAKQVLGYSYNGSFDYNTAPESVKWWLSQYESQIQDGMGSSSSTPSKVAATRSSVDNLITTQWNQTYPYNKLIPCPTGHEGQLATGCVATAMAQIMKKYNYPDVGIGEKSYQKIYNGTDTVTFSANFARTTYDWNNMLDRYSGSYSTTEADAVATLMYHAGVALNMDYSTSSSAKDMSLGTALIDNFGYDKGISYLLRDNYTDEDWTNTIYSELVAGRPVYYSGQSNNGGHGFVIHGYNANTDKFSINWGWGGYCDGQFSINGSNALKPGGSGTGGAGSSASYSQNQAILIGIRPDVGNDYVWQTYMVSDHPFSMTENGVATNFLSINKNDGDKRVNYKFCAFNSSFAENQFSFGLQFIDENTKQSKIIENIFNSPSMPTNGGYTIPYTFSTSILEYNGTFKIYPVFRVTGSSDEWKRVNFPIIWDMPTIEITNAKEPDKINVDFQISATAMKEGTSVNITCNSNYSGKITCTAEDSSIVSITSSNNTITLTGQKAGTTNVIVKGEAQGYYIATERSFEITVTEVPVVPVSMSITGSEIAIGDTIHITHDHEYTGNITYNCEPAGIVSISEDGTVRGISEGSVIITATADSTRFFTRTNAYFTVNVTSKPKSVYITDIKIPNNGYITYEDLAITASFKNNSGYNYIRYPIICIFKGNYLSLSNAVYIQPFYQDNEVTYTFKFEKFNVNGVATDFSTLLENYSYGDKDFAVTITDGSKNLLSPNEKSTIYFTLVDKQTVNCNINSKGWGVVMLPFEATLPEGLTAYSCNAYDNPVLTLTEITDKKLNMDTPYIIKGAEGTYTFSGPQIPNKLDTYSSGLLVGTTKNDTIPTDSYVLDTRNDICAFYKVNANEKQDISAYNVYLTLPESGIATDILYLDKSDYHIKGDVNGDYTVDISDVNAIISVICGGTFNPFADINNDGSVDISDVNAAISIICGN